MLNGKHISVIIPALNEQDAIPSVLAGLWSLRGDQNQRLIDDIVVCDNGSTDKTAQVSRSFGARVVYESFKGYGAACLAGINALSKTDVVLFIDADASCKTDQAYQLIEPLCHSRDIHLVIGSRTLGVMEPGSLTPPQRMGNWLASHLIKLLWRRSTTDLGPFRAIRYQALKRLGMQDKRFGWTVEMQIKAIQKGLNTLEIPVDSTKRIGVSKISGTVSGVLGAAIGIISKILILRFSKGSAVSKKTDRPLGLFSYDSRELRTDPKVLKLTRHRDQLL